MEQSFSKADRCFHSGRFGPRAADTERRRVSVLTMVEKSEQDILRGARRLFASAVKKHTGKLKRKRMDAGVPRKKQAGSEATFLRKKRKAVTEAIRALPASSTRSAASDDRRPMSTKATKELAMPKKRRLDRAVAASREGRLLSDDEGREPFTQAAAQKKKHAQQDAKRIAALAARQQDCHRVCAPRDWNWKSLGARKTWSSCPVPTELL